LTPVIYLQLHNIFSCTYGFFSDIALLLQNYVNETSPLMLRLCFWGFLGILFHYLHFL